MWPPHQIQILRFPNLAIATAIPTIATVIPTNVYSAEVTAFELAADIALASPLNYTNCVIYGDSQAAIQGIKKPNKQSSQIILISAIDKLQGLVDQRQMSIEINWISGHEDIRGNEEAD